MDQGEDQSRKDYFFRMEYPDDYKAYQTKIIKFDRDYNEEMQYNFYGMYPYQIKSIPVKYEGSDILKLSVNVSCLIDTLLVNIQVMISIEVRYNN